MANRSHKTRSARAALMALAVLVSMPSVVHSGNRAGDDGTETWGRVSRVGMLLPGMIADPVRDRLVLFGGIDGDGNVSSDVWVKPLAGSSTWTRLDINGPRPTARTAPAIVYDPVRDRMLVFGDTYASDGGGIVWALSLSGNPAWAPLTAPGDGPGFRSGPSAIYDAARDRLVVFVGYSAAADSDMCDVWALSLSGTPAWTRILPAGVAPTRRTLASMAYDPAGDRLVLFGGFQDLRPLAAIGEPAARDVWAMSLGDAPAWTELHPGGAVVPGLFECASAFDPVRRRLLVFGGDDSSATPRLSRDVWALTLGGAIAWTRLATSDPGPMGTAGMSASYDSMRDRIVVFGGQRSETWALALDGGLGWTPLEPGDGFGPGGRYAHSTVYDPARRSVLLFGGAFYDDGGGHHARTYRFDDLWRLTFEPRPEWAPVPRDSAPPPRWGQSAVLDPVADRLVVFGGTKTNPDDNGPVEVAANDLWWLPLSTTGPWSSPVTDDSVPPARTSHTAVYDAAHRRMIVFGGIDAPDVFGDVWALALEGPPRWTRLAIAGPGPEPRYGHAAIYDPTGDRMIVFGGQRGATLLDDTWQLSLAGEPAWTPLSPDVRPPARSGACLAFDSRRRRLVLFGGSANQLLSDTWLLPLAEGARWQAGTMNGDEPEPRDAASAVYAADFDRVILTGGRGISGWSHVNISGSWALASSAPVTETGSAIPLLPFSLAGPTPNPASLGITVRFSLPDAARARLEVADIAGRRWASREVGVMGPGDHVLAVTAPGALPPGVYFVRLSRGGQSLVKRVSVIR